MIKKCRSTHNAYDGDYYYDIQCEKEEGHEGNHCFSWNEDK